MTRGKKLAMLQDNFSRSIGSQKINAIYFYTMFFENPSGHGRQH